MGTKGESGQQLGARPDQVRLKRAYDPPDAGDGMRVLVDRLWPRGLSKDQAKVDLWLKEIAPSNELRRWYGHDPDRWDEFHQRYSAELAQNQEALDRLRELTRSNIITLLYGARDRDRNNAVVLRDVLGAGRREHEHRGG